MGGGPQTLTWCTYTQLRQNKHTKRNTYNKKERLQTTAKAHNKISPKIVTTKSPRQIAEMKN